MPENSDSTARILSRVWLLSLAPLAKRKRAPTIISAPMTQAAGRYSLVLPRKAEPKSSAGTSPDFLMRRTKK